MRWLLSSAICLAVATVSIPSQAADETPRVEFSRDIRPILSNVCFDCHGPDKNQRKADLRLDQREDLYRDQGGYALIVPGKPAASELYSRIVDPDETQRMPPPDALRQLTQEQTDLIRRWIEQGGEWQGHWAYVAPSRPAIPAVQDDGRWIRNDVDRFILRRLREHGLQESPEADKVTLIRRLSFDLTGLPPTPHDVAEFVGDRSGEAYEKLVDRLLAAPHFGERMAMLWLDLVRYADTNGYHGDNHEDRDMFRDWVIQAFNRNLPYDQFTIEQVAGDLLPDGTTDQKIASGYNRLLMTTREGGAQAREYMAKYSADRVRNFSAVWLAGTMGCSECHDHKYDPYTMRDFYSLAAFFADIQEVAVGEQPGTKIPTPTEQSRLAALDARMAPLKTILDTPTPELEQAQIAWEGSLKSRTVEWTVLRPTEFKSAGGATLKLLDDGSLLAGGTSPERDTYELTFQGSLKEVTSLRLEVLPDDSLPAKGPGRAGNGNFVVHELSAAIDGRPVAWSHASATHSQGNYDVQGSVDGKAETGWAILEQVGKPSHAVFELRPDQTGAQESRLTIVLAQNYGTQHTLGRFRFSSTQAARPVRADGGNGLPPNIVEIVALEPDQRSDAQRLALAAFFRTQVPQLEATRRQLGELQKERDAVFGGVRTTLVSTAGPPRMIRMLPRGNWLDESGEAVAPAPPAFLAPNLTAPGEGRLSRLDLGQWLVSPAHPLTARVFVNRLWKVAFGQGLVRSTEDFGAQGTPPTHPDLLDWLALEFASPATAGVAPSDGVPWDVKRLLKLIVMSGTYRQTSLAREGARQQDPFNLWLARQGRFRLDAEMVRDNALAIGGLLVDQVGGPSARPYQPGGYWAYLNFPVREWQADQGAGLYRRGLYTYWCRTFLHPSLKAFDAPTREECTAERPRSNTPLQALVLLNDPSYVEAARAFAERVLRLGGDRPETRLEFAFEQALTRPIRDAERELLMRLYEKHLAQYAQDPAACEALLRIGERPVPEDLNRAELAAWTSVCRAILNLHEVVTRN
ncbi:MAG: PSD1 and planctomycete cytochrome C domain-containing protein [Planctomycetales bacterium]